METRKEVSKQPRTYTYPQTTVLRTASSPGSNLDRHGGSILNRRQHAVFNSLDVGIQMVFSTASIVSAFAVASTIGIVFGFVPARNAARLDPVNALMRE